ncbi:helix-turn-helix domain-containing protein [Geodermatophilus sp. SYSU D00758]
MSDTQDRWARKRTRTREHVRDTADRLFTERGFEAVTVAEVAATADVAVQTVFNHFPGKEALFSADRTPWVAGPAAPGTAARVTAAVWLAAVGTLIRELRTGHPVADPAAGEAGVRRVAAQVFGGLAAAAAAATGSRR